MALKNPDLKRRLVADPRAGEQNARNILAQDAGQPAATLLLAAALRLAGRPAEARQVSSALVKSQPQLGAAWFELGLAAGELGDRTAAFSAHLRAIDLNLSDPEYWYPLVDTWLLARKDEVTGADAEAAARGLAEGYLQKAELLLRAELDANEKNALFLKLFADVLIRQARFGEAEPLLVRSLEIDPDFHAARFRYASELFARNRFADALPQAQRLLMSHPNETVFRLIEAVSLSRCWRFEEAIGRFESLLQDTPDLPGIWLAYAAALRAIGRKAEASNSIIRATEVLPEYAEAYRTLATVKSFHFTPGLVEALRLQLARPALPAQDRADFHYALGKALEDAGAYGESFEHYRSYNELMRTNSPYSAEKHTRFVADSRSVLTKEFFQGRLGSGLSATDPVFVVGMPRSGSTLLEQILSSHSEIEGVGELPFLSMLTARLDGEFADAYPRMLPRLDAARLQQLGEEYLALSRRRAQLGRQFFVDKNNVNLHHIGLLQLILPNARIIETRRHPLDCGLSCFKTYLPRGASFPRRMDEIGRYYKEHVELMAHYDEVLPGKVHRVIYERLIADPEAEVRRLLEFLGLPFEEQCLRFHEQERVVLTPSAEQIRQPLHAGSLAYWRNYEPWLGPLKAALGEVLEAYPDVPAFPPVAPPLQGRPSTPMGTNVGWSIGWKGRA